ncbi:MAG: sulfite exporter TauE/SafE family protein [Bacteroidetes bacterium]|nr:sulfite exporter TauE/SafE family protein [Bacteroidota bacterium]
MSTSTLLILVLIGFFAGILSGMIGIGGGILIIPALVFFLKIDQQTAQGTSVAIMLPPIGIFAVYNYYKAGYVNVSYALVIALAFIVGGYFGSVWALKIPSQIMRKVFSVIMVLIAIRMYFK